MKYKTNSQNKKELTLLPCINMTYPPKCVHSIYIAIWRLKLGSTCTVKAVSGPTNR
jgi:hypothetical protein